MDSKKLARILADILNEYRRSNGSVLHIVDDVKTYEELDIRLFNSGVVVKCVDDGVESEYQISVVQSK